MDSTSIGSNGSAGDGPGKVPLTFARADQMYVSLKRLHDTGVLTADAFDEQLKQMMVKDSLGRWWSKSRDSGEWFYYDGTDWVRGVPPVESPAVPPVVPSVEQTMVTGDLTTDTTGGSPGPQPLAVEDLVEDLMGSDDLVDLAGVNETTESVRPPDPLPEPVPDPTPDPIVGTRTLAEPGPRTVAFLIDGGILLAADIICETIGIGWLAWIIYIGYYGYYWSTTGQTLGMKSQNLRVVRVDGRPVTWETAAVRLVGYFVGALCVLIGLLWVYWDPQRQGWHDKMAQTLVVSDKQ